MIIDNKVPSWIFQKLGLARLTAFKVRRTHVEAVLYRYRTGIPWRDLPERFGDFRVIHTRLVGLKRGFGSRFSMF
ncbi:MAG: transposase [Hormoscilla sp. GUM202]|nr:transposase [Hormoscilla sp. GUM202]